MLACISIIVYNHDFYDVWLGGYDGEANMRRRRKKEQKYSFPAIPDGENLRNVSLREGDW